MGVIAICDNLGPLDNFRSLPLLGEIKAGIARSRMRAFYLAYTEEVTILSQPVTELEAPVSPEPSRLFPGATISSCYLS